MMRLFRNAEGKPRIWTHYNDRRWFIHVGDHCIRFEWGRVRGVRWLEYRMGGGNVEGVQLTAGFGFGGWLTWETPWHRPFRWMHLMKEREFGLNSSGGRLRLLFGRDPFGSRYFGGSGLTRFQRILANRELCLFRFVWIVGRDKVTRTELLPPRRALCVVGQWTGDEYIVEVKAERMEWRNRVRKIVRQSWDVRTPDGEKAPPIPGKGENSWDCDDDGIYGSRSEATRVSDDPEAIGEALESLRQKVLAARQRYGGANWRPREATTA